MDCSTIKLQKDVFLPIYFENLPLLTPGKSGDVKSILKGAFLLILDFDLIKYS